MKKALLSLSLLYGFFVQAQVNDTLYVNFDKSVFLMFGTPVEFSKVNSKFAVNNVDDSSTLSIQALQEDMHESNLLVKTSTGELYTFILVYSKDPKKFVYDYQNFYSVQNFLNKHSILFSVYLVILTILIMIARAKVLIR